MLEVIGFGDGRGASGVDPIARGNILGTLVRSFRVIATPTGAIVDNTSPQAVWMEFGTRPHWAPFSALMTWATQKARDGGVNAHALARAAQLSIARRGTAPRHFWKRALAKAAERVPRLGVLLR